ncbi:MAG: cysteine hydrolase family protein [Ahrensia sp.]|nr:cysteine hydrolase family protein [Ahrensia sp.]
MSATLVIIDMQKALDDPRYGTRGQHDAEANMARLLTHWRDLGNPVVHVRDNSLDPDSPYAPGKATHEFKPQLAPLQHEPIIDKQTNNAFIGTDLMQVLEEFGSSDLIVCGVHLHQCVESTVRMAGNLGFLVFLPEDCVICVDVLDRKGNRWTADQVHDLTLAILDGDYCKVVSSADLMGSAADGVIH